MIILGDPGWCYRARVPQAQSNTYSNRPEWSSHVDMSKESRKTTNRLDKHLRAAQERKKLARTRRAVDISVEGRKMAL
jgi:transcription factor SPN1